MHKKIDFLVILFATIWVAVACSTQETDPLGRPLPTLSIPHTASAITIDGRLDEPAWQTAATVDAFAFTWWEAGKKENTRARLTWDEDCLYVGFECEDAYIWAEYTERDSAVYRDDCVEVFTAPDPRQLGRYFNLEMNVQAVSLDFYHPEGPGSKEPWEPKVAIATSVEGTLNDDSDTDQRWFLEVAIPFAAFSKVARNTPPLPGDEWRLNLNRLGGKTNPQFSQWSPGDPENRGFHSPEFFGRIRFIP